jgi:hypothetical protein
MGLQLTFSNIVQLFSIFSPMFLIFFLVTVSIFNQNIKGLVYLAGVLLASVINTILSVGFGSEMGEDASPLCNIIDFPFISSKYNVPAFNSMFIMFTLAYLLLPMIANNQINFFIVGMIVSLFIIDAYVKLTNNCTLPKGIVFGALTGIVLGTAWFYTLYISDNTKPLLFFSDLTSNNVVCKRPANQTFKCSVYKNGQLIQDA